MAFCTSCGAQIADGAKFCTGCGAAQAQAPQPVASSQAAAPASAPAAAVQAAPKQNSGLKVVLIVLAVVFGLIVLAVAGAIGASVYVAHKLKQGMKVEQRGKDATIATPWGNISTTTDANKVAEQLGVDVYPGATALNEGASVSGIPGMSVATAKFESDDPIDKVEQFYTSKFPHSTVNTGNENSRTIVSTGEKGAVTIVLRNDDGKTRIEVSRVGGAAKSSESGH